MTIIESLGLVAATLTTVAFIPQAVKTITTHATKDLSVSTYVLMSLGTLAWFIYGTQIGDVPIMLANSITFLLSVIILTFKLTENSGRKNAVSK